MTTFPEMDWQEVTPEDAGFDPIRFAGIGAWLAEEAAPCADSRYRVVIRPRRRAGGRMEQPRGGG